MVTSPRYTSDALNRIVAAGALVVGYDGRCNITSSGSDAYTFTSENLMKSGSGGAALSYNPAGRLYQTSKGALTTRMQYDGSDLIAEYNAANVLQRRALRLHPSPGWLRSSLHGPGADEPILWYEGSTLTDKRYLLS